MKTKYIGLLAAAAFAFTACDSDDTRLADPVVNDTTASTTTVTYSSGTADFSNYVAVGNSLTAGFSDGSLFKKGQEVGMTKLLANQFALAGGGEFTVPYTNDDLGGLLLGGNVIAPTRLIFDVVNQTPVNVDGTPTNEITQGQPGPYNNMGVPGAKSFHLLAPGYGNASGVLAGTANPFFVRMASSPTTSVLADALAMSPTFFSLWIGNNDVLGYATSGGDGTNPITPLDGAPGVGFTQTYNAILAQLLTQTDKGIIANIPNVTDAPFFTTVPHNPIPLDAQTAGFLNSPSAYGAYNAGLAQLQSLGVISAEELQKRTITFTAGEGNAVVIMDENLTDLTGFNAALVSMRQATEDDLLVLSSRSFIGTEAVPGNPATINGVAIPLADKWVLTPEEQQEVADATEAFNNVIATAAANANIPLFDVNTFFNQVATSGYQAGSAFMTADYVTGGTFSLDGIHPSPRGNAVVVNQMIALINETYGSNLPTINPVDYTGVYLD